MASLLANYDPGLAAVGYSLVDNIYFESYKKCTLYNILCTNQYVLKWKTLKTIHFDPFQLH